MRVEPYGVGSILHIVKRGARGMNIVRDTRDRERFRSSLFYLNDSFSDPNWTEALKLCAPFERPSHWPEKDPLVRILAWTLLPNHFHLVVEEIREEGTAKFMQRLCGSMSASFNAKYKEQGSIFQGAYKSKTIDTDAYLRYLIFYVQVKNVFELYPGGLAKAVKEFEKAWGWATMYAFSSLQNYTLGTQSLIVDEKLFKKLYPNNKTFKETAKEALSLHIQNHDEKFSHLLLESW
jgi:putative transposase